MLVAVSGLSATGKSTLAKAIAKRYNLRYFAAGGDLWRQIAKERGLEEEQLSEEAGAELHKMIDQRTKEEAKKGNVVLEGRLTVWMVPEAIKIYIKAGADAKAKRVMARYGLDFGQAREKIVQRDKADKQKYKEIYGIDTDDFGKVDLVVDNTHLSAEDTQKVCFRFLDSWKE